jgi:hypothetical protein
MIEYIYKKRTLDDITGFLGKKVLPFKFEAQNK